MSRVQRFFLFELAKHQHDYLGGTTPLGMYRGSHATIEEAKAAYGEHGEGPKGYSPYGPVQIIGLTDKFELVLVAQSKYGSDGRFSWVEGEALRSASI